MGSHLWFVSFLIYVSSNWRRVEVVHYNTDIARAKHPLIIAGTCNLVNVFHMFSDKCVHLNYVRVVFIKNFECVNFAITAIRSTRHLWETFESAPEGRLQTQCPLIAFNSRFSFELLFEHKAQQIVSWSAIWNVPVFIEVQMVVSNNIALVSLILWQFCSCQGEFCLIIPVKLDAN